MFKLNLRDYYEVVRTADGEYTTGSIQEEGSKIKNGHRLMLKLQGTLRHKGKSSSLPELSAEEERAVPPTTPEPEYETAKATETEQETETATASTTTTTSNEGGNTEHGNVSDCEPSQQVGKPDESKCITVKIKQRCPICNREIVVTRLGPCCKLWAKAYSYKRRPNATTKVPNSIRQ